MGPARALLAPLLAPTRPMDGMALSWGLPAEDEIATTVLSGGVSPYLSLVFLREARRRRALLRRALRALCSQRGPLCPCR